MKIPKEIKIGGFIWTVDYNEAVSNEGNAFGSTHYRKQRIFLDKNETQQKKEQCLLHEIMHALLWQSGSSKRFKDADCEEGVVQALSNGFYQVLKDNKFI